MKANVSISRTNRNEILVTIKDVASRIKVAEINFSLEEYALLISGMSEIEGEIIYGNLIHVGKEKIVEKRQCVIPKELYYAKKEEIKNWLEENKQEEGWYLDAYLGSQDSFVYGSEEIKINYFVYKYE